MKFKRVYIELTNRCNFACEFCPESIMTRKRGDMDLSLLDKILNEIREAQLTKTIHFHVMGEPLLYPHMDKAIKCAKTKGFKVCITTNGWLMTEEMIEEFINVGVDDIIFSVQTPDSRSFDFRKSKVDFDEYRKKISFNIAKTFKSDMYTNVTISFLVTPLKDIFLPSKKISILDTKKDLHKHLILWLREILDKANKNELTAKIEKNLGEIEEQIKKINIFGWNRLRITNHFMLETRLLGDWIHPGIFSNVLHNAFVGSCEGLKEHFGILWNGDLVFCCVDFDGNTAFGNIKHTTIKDAFQKEKTQRVIKGFKRFRILHPYCKRCLGDVSLQRSIVRQLGSIIYFKFYRRWWEKKRVEALPIIR